jgi:hypothetical protein
MYDTKNYTEQGGEKTVIGGELEITGDAKVSGFPKAAFQAQSTASDVAGIVSDFNSLLTKLVEAGLMQADES